jgi:ubiquinone/menaquinone biosynthesis C-methylase UbiE
MTTTAPDFAAIKRRQQATWASGDYHMIGTQVLITSELLIEALDVRSTERVLDVATGSGNAALAAARRGCTVVGVDYVPALLDRARKRADAEGVEAEFVEGDAEALPFEDGSFDVVASVFGAMFAPNQEQAARELARVCRSGGRIGLVAHTPEGFIGQLFKTNAKHVPPPAGLRSPVLWGTRERLEELFGESARVVRAEKRELVFRYRSPDAYIDYWRTYYGPTLKAFEAVGESGRAALESDLRDLIARFNRADDGTMVVPNEYLEAVLVKQ